MNRPAPSRAPSGARILVVESDPDSRQDIGLCLQARGHQVELTDDLTAIAQAARRGHELLVLTLETRRRRGPDPWTQLRALREQGAVLPVLALLPASHAADRAVALELGADAVLDKPFHPGELRARVQALLRRARQEPTPSPSAVRFGDWELEPDSRTLRAPTGLQVMLSEAECALLQAFLEHPRSPLNRQQLLELARQRGESDPPPLDRSIDLLVSRLRQKLEDDPRSPRLIHTVRGVGYLFQALGERDPALARA